MSLLQVFYSVIEKIEIEISKLPVASQKNNGVFNLSR